MTSLMNPISLDFPASFSVLKQQSSVMRGRFSKWRNDVWMCFENLCLVSHFPHRLCLQTAEPLLSIYSLKTFTLPLFWSLCYYILNLVCSLQLLFTNSSSLLPPLFPNPINIWPRVHLSLTFFLYTHVTITAFQSGGYARKLSYLPCSFLCSQSNYFSW